jgi:hypothetical protein
MALEGQALIKEKTGIFFLLIFIWQKSMGTRFDLVDL